VLGDQAANVSDPDDREEYSNDREGNTNRSRKQLAKSDVEEPETRSGISSVSL
jgi:hypothetical protein